jgi:hypothetical protein
MTVIHIDRFSAGLDDLTRKQQADHIEVLRVLSRTGRFSCFEASENDTIARTMTRLIHKGYTTVDFDGKKTDHGLLLKKTGGAYPWTTCELTDAGKRLLEASP